MAAFSQRHGNVSSGFAKEVPCSQVGRPLENLDYNADPAKLLCGKRRGVGGKSEKGKPSRSPLGSGSAPLGMVFFPTSAWRSFRLQQIRIKGKVSDNFWITDTAEKKVADDAVHVNR
jgi:hypothetical protein